MALGVDISENNGYVDFEMLREAGVEFIIARAGYGMGHEDGCFSHYVETARDYGFKLGAYWFSYSLDPEQARQEGQYAASIVSATDCLFELPIFYDTENSSWRDTHGWNPADATAECDAFMPISIGSRISLIMTPSRRNILFGLLSIQANQI